MTVVKLKQQDKPWAEFSAPDVGMLVHAMQLHLLKKQPNLKLKTQHKQLLGSLPLAFVLPGETNMIFLELQIFKSRRAEFFTKVRKSILLSESQQG